MEKNYKTSNGYFFYYNEFNIKSRAQKYYLDTFRTCKDNGFRHVKKYSNFV